MNKNKANRYKAFFRGLLDGKDHQYKQWCLEEDHNFCYNRLKSIGNISIKTTVEIFGTFGDFYCAAISVTVHRNAHIEGTKALSETQDLVHRIYFNDIIPMPDCFENEVIDLIKKLGWL